MCCCFFVVDFGSFAVQGAEIPSDIFAGVKTILSKTPKPTRFVSAGWYETKGYTYGDFVLDYRKLLQDIKNDENTPEEEKDACWESYEDSNYFLYNKILNHSGLFPAGRSKAGAQMKKSEWQKENVNLIILIFEDIKPMHKMNVVFQIYYNKYRLTFTQTAPSVDYDLFDYNDKKITQLIKFSSKSPKHNQFNVLFDARPILNDYFIDYLQNEWDNMVDKHNAKFGRRVARNTRSIARNNRNSQNKRSYVSAHGEKGDTGAPSMKRRRTLKKEKKEIQHPDQDIQIDLAGGDDSSAESENEVKTKGSQKEKIEASEESQSDGDSQDRSEHDNLEIKNKDDRDESENDNDKKVQARSRSVSRSSSRSRSRSRTRTRSPNGSGSNGSSSGSRSPSGSVQSDKDNVEMEAVNDETERDRDSQEEDDIKTNILPDKHTPTGETDEEPYSNDEYEDDYDDTNETDDGDGLDKGDAVYEGSDHNRYPQDSDIGSSDIEISSNLRRSKRIQAQNKNKSGSNTVDSGSSSSSDDESSEIVLDIKFPYELNPETDIEPKKADLRMETQKKNNISGKYKKEMFIDPKYHVKTINIKVRDVNLRLTAGKIPHVMAYKTELCVGRNTSLFFGDGKPRGDHKYDLVIKFNRKFSQKYNAPAAQIGGTDKIEKSGQGTGQKKFKLMTNKIAGVLLGYCKARKSIKTIRRITREALKLKGPYDISFKKSYERFECLKWRRGAKCGGARRVKDTFVAFKWGVYLFHASMMLNYNTCVLRFSNSITLKPSVKGFFEETVGFVDDIGKLSYICIHICNLFIHKCIYLYVLCLYET